MTESQPGAESLKHPRRQQRCGGDLKAVFACPDCGTRGWVYWRRLPLGMKCRACGGGFWVDARGQVQSFSSVPKVRFRCPRCDHVAMLPEPFVSRTVRCPGCAARFFRQPDGSLLSEKELAEQKAAARAQAASSARKRTAEGHISPTRGRRTRVAMLAAMLLALGVVGLFAGRRWLAAGNTLAAHSSVDPEQLAPRLAECCLTGRMEEARAMVAPDQREAFDIWLTLIGRPPGEEQGARKAGQPPPEVSVLQVQQAGASRLIRLRIKLPGQVEVLQTQVWTQVDARWRFDARRTLQAIEGMGG